MYVHDVHGCIDVCATYAGWVCLLCIHVYELCIWVYSCVFVCTGMSVYGLDVPNCMCELGVGMPLDLCLSE